MRKLLLPAIIIWSAFQLPAQITITKNDMPTLGDNILISVNTSLSGFHKDSTGANYFWDYSRLIPDSQRYEQFVSPAVTPYSTPFTFLCGLGGYGQRNYTPDAFPWSLIGGGATPTNAYYFYKNSSSDFKCLGEPLTAGTTPIPIPYSAQDRIYKFPMNYLQKDSSDMKLSLPNIPGLGSYVKKQHRVNEVDGWGTITTPYGTFNCLRVKSTLTITDSVYIDTLNFGFTIPRPIAYEFKWLANGMKIPILEIDATAAGGNNVTITRANWRDSLMVTPSVSFTEQNSCPVVNEGSLTAIPSGARYPLTYSWSTGATTSTISNLAPGTYSVTITDRYGRVIHAVDSVKALNDSSCLILVSFASTKTCPMAKNGALTATVTGARMPAHYLWSNGDTTLTISNLAPGNYDFMVTDKYGRTASATGIVEGTTQDITCLNIPSAFTPDNDGTNDVWRIRSLNEYTDCSVEVFNQWGSLVFKSKGYETPWDGTYNGDPVPAGAYYYVIDLKNGTNKFNGTVTIIK
ncbi:MAG: gliding motility-associated C-terminal domain-containing protein [Bacteroidia bacterium]